VGSMYRQTLGKMRAWLLQENPEPRRAPRNREPEVVVHYWDGSAPEARQIRDMSETGAFICTPERWYLGTIIRLTLQGHQMVAREDGAKVPAASITVRAQVVRHASDGVGVAFAFLNDEEEEAFRTFLAAIPSQPPAASGPSPGALRRNGQALIEFALLIPLVFLLAVNALNFAGFLFAWITVANAARDGAQYMVMSKASPGAPTAATLGQVTTLVTNDVTSLLNRASVVVNICTNANGTMTPAACTTLADPESPLYTLATVDVTYTYQPFIPLFSFPGTHISATLPSSAIHRKAVMRMLQ
jgi:Flp pilus assembly protein TadG